MVTLEWTKNLRHRYSIHALDYSICKVGLAEGWRYEVWKGDAQLVVGLHSAEDAKEWCQRYHEQTRGDFYADVDEAGVLVGV